VVELARAARTLPDTVVAWGVNLPSFGVYYGHVVPLREPVAGEVVLTRDDRLPQLPPAEILQRQGGLLLARIKAAATASAPATAADGR
jgi:hypothetical protein